MCENGHNWEKPARKACDQSETWTQEAKLVACDKPLACFRSASLLFGAAPSGALPRDRSPSRLLHEMRNEIVVLGIRSPSLELNMFDDLAVDSLLDCVRLIG